MARQTKVSRSYARLQAIFGSERAFRFARMAKGVITHGQVFKKGDLFVEMDQPQWDSLLKSGLVRESVMIPGSFHLSG